ncbi:GerAB/ArcD/ProY family transporter [Acetohalobium arabaticum]|uniref:Spore germination protein n=1 Tax=Acetohalobium arabaticum (strain ATCC 49924 / DSM 5501 / Z-7288) TaxID=574087 RepID=D9QSN8_ACEAZ|nr:endospore germination permease [Acetohalobium arabaticum]ADL13501.1 spore germination protein [Acetohalobium arabaticum DSM 5501]
MKQKKISLFQYSALLITFLLGTIIIICPEVIISDQLGWLTDITAIALSFISILLLTALHQPLFDSNIVEIANQVGGVWFRIVVGILYIIYVLHLGALNLRLIGNFLSTTIMSNMPILIFTFTLTLVSAYAVTMGIETIARVGQVILPVILLIFTLLLILAIPDYDPSNLLPLKLKTKNLLQGGYLIWAFPLGNLILFSFLFPYVRLQSEKSKTKQYLLYTSIALLISGVILTLRTLTLTMAFGADLASSFTYPVFSMVGIIEIGDFLERLESAFLVMWIGTAFITILFCYWTAVEAVGTLVRSKNKKSFIIPIGIIMVSLSQILFKNYSEQYQFTLHTWPHYAAIFLLIIPVIILLLLLLKKIKNNIKDRQ